MTWLVLQAAAITLVFTEGSLFAKLRAFGPQLWKDLVSCSLCLGVWVGMGMYVLHSPPIAHYAYWLQVLGFGCISGVVAYTGAAIWAVLDHHSGEEVEVRIPRNVSHYDPRKPTPEVLKMAQKIREKAS